MPDLMAWRGKRTPSMSGEKEHTLAYDILLWVIVIAGALGAALVVFYFFPPG
jgi:hypothetical protein